MAGKKKDGAGPANDVSQDSVEVLGSVKRVVRRAVTDADRTDLDTGLHALLDSQIANERQQKRAQKALGKLRERAKNIDAQILELHTKRSEAVVEEILSCRVERTSTEIRIVQPNGEAIYSRPLTKEEHEQLGAKLPGMEPAKVHHPELDPSDEVAKVETSQAEAKALRIRLANPLSFEAAIAEVDDEENAESDDSDDDEDKPKKGKKAKGKGKKMEQMDLLEKGNSDGAVH